MMPVGLEIKEMTLKDCSQVAKVEESCFSVPWSLKSFEDTFLYQGNHYLTAWSGDKIIGFIGMMAVGEEADITNVAVLPTYRKEGIASLLVKEILDVAVKYKIHKILLEVRASNKAAIRLYEKYEFHFLSTRNNYYEMPTEDADIMCWSN
ncbi:MAG: ribosomal protein S18-alanine N-acetyltransferase [Lachnospiraceae bacterium]|nr:ribosomal protein S18-alanine N-acetyltransferase [Lachnospiraceae bacterium]